jgi:hypothetical protein
VVGAEFAGELLAVTAPGDGDGLVAELRGELDGEVSQAADPEDGDPSAACVPALRTALKVVTPAQPNGAASKRSRSSGMRASVSAGTVMLWAQPPG